MDLPAGTNPRNLSHFINADGQCLYAKYWHPAEGVPIRALLCVAHGMGEHCERYGRMAQQFTSNGILVFAHDHIGHGKSEGTRGDVGLFQFFVRDCHQHIDLMRAKYPDVPIFLYGHSMGGTIAILVAYEKPSLFANTGVLLSSPAIVIDPELVTPVKLFLGKIISTIWPCAPMGELDLTSLSRDPQVVKDYETDPLVYHGKIQARLALQTIQATKRVQNGLVDVRWPFLLQHGDVDRLTNIAGSELMNEKAPSKDKTFTVYKGYYHELDKEPGEDGEKVIRELVDWVLERLPRA